MSAIFAETLLAYFYRQALTMRIFHILSIGFYVLFGFDAPAQGLIDTSKKIRYAAPVESRFYTGSDFDFAILSTALLERPRESSQLTIPRFTAFVNFGFHAHYDPNRRFGLFSGLNVKNIGFIQKIGDITAKHRVYTLGIPLGIKFGDLQNRNFYFLGGGVDLPFNYREKVFERRGDKDKFNEWFSDRTARFMPYVFIGKSWDPGVTLKLQYYPTNFMNPEFAEDINGLPVRPYAGYNVNLILLSLGIDIHYGMYALQQKEYLEWKRNRTPVSQL